MRVIESEMLDAIRNGKNWTKSNTSVEFFQGTEFSVYLFGNHIATGDIKTKELRVFDAGWQTNTTKSRINALGAYVFQRDWKWFVKINGEEKPFVSGADIFKLDI